MKIHYLLATRYDNFGDYVINLELIRLLCGQGQVEIDDFGCDSTFLDQLKSEIGNYRRPATTLKTLSGLLGAFMKNQTPNFLVLSPGAMAILPKPKWIFRGFCMYLVLSLLRLRGTKIIRLGVSRKPQGHSLVDRLMILWMRQTDGIYFRDQISLKYYMPHSHHGQRIGYFPDLALYLPCKISDEVSARSNVIGLSFRYPEKSTVGESFSLQGLVDLSVDWHERGYQCRFYHQVEADAKYGAEVAETFRRATQRAEMKVIEVNSQDAADHEYVQPQALLTNRLHVALLCLLAGGLPVPVCSKNENAKLFGLFERIGLRSLCLDPALSEELKAAHIEHVLANRVKALEGFPEKLFALKEEGRILLKEIFNCEKITT